MKKTILLVLGILCAAALWAADTVQPLDVKLGLWETTVTHESSGAPPIPPEVLAKISPEQRAKMEAMWKARQAQGPQTETRKSCLTKEQLNKAAWLDDTKDENCTKTVVSSTPRHLEAKLECTRGAMKQSGTFTVDAVDSTSAKGVVHMVMSGGGNTMNANSTFTSKWIGASCGDVK